MNNTRGINILKYLLLLYILSLGLTDLLELPVVGKKVQIPEIIFIPLFFVWLGNIRKQNLNQLQPRALEAAIGLVVLVMILSASFSNGRSWMEVLGMIYLATVYFIYKSSLSLLPDTGSFITRSVLLSGIIAAGAGMAGWILSQLGISTILSMPADIQYPYLGFVARATGLMNSPNMLFNFLCICLLLGISQWKKNEHDQTFRQAAIVVITVGAILTFSKSILLLIIAILFLFRSHYFFKTKVANGLVTISSVLLFLVWILGTHFLLRKPTTADLTTGAEKAYTLATPSAHFMHHDVYLTNYTINKQATVEAGLRNPVLGVGPGNFNSFVGKLKEEGSYPVYFINFDPHSTYLGAFAETGVLGLIALLFLCFQVWKMITGSILHSSYEHPLLIGMAACFLFMAMDAISMDVMNFRHLWVLLGILAYLFAKQTHDIKTVGKDQEA